MHPAPKNIFIYGDRVALFFTKIKRKIAHLIISRNDFSLNQNHAILICMEKKIYESWNEGDTYRFGEKMAAAAGAGSLYCLEGDLGVGKTVFTQGFAHGLGIDEPVTSPTFTIVQEYETGRLPLYHFDVYRLADPEELEEIGYEEYFFGEGVCLIEWPSRIEELIPSDAIRITIEKELSRGFDYRKITVTGGRVDHE